MRDAGCRVEFFRRVEAPAIIFPGNCWIITIEATGAFW